MTWPGDVCVSEKNHVGIVNVRERIQLNFGEKYGMKIECVNGKGICDGRRGAHPPVAGVLHQ